MLKLHNYEGVKPITKYYTSSNMKCSILLSFAIYLKILLERLGFSPMDPYLRRCGTDIYCIFVQNFIGSVVQLDCLVLCACHLPRFYFFDAISLEKMRSICGLLVLRFNCTRKSTVTLLNRLTTWPQFWYEL